MSFGNPSSLTLPTRGRKLFRILKTDWFIGLCLLGIFLASNGYTYAWDDQHLEIPLLKSLIDPALYHGDYYVESLKKNFPSYLYPILARLISVSQIPAAYGILYVISRYFLFFWMYKFWLIVVGRKRPETAISNGKAQSFFSPQFIAFLCTVTTIMVGRIEEFLYRTFSHQEFALGMIMAGIYFFYKERFVLAAILLGIAANFHALYSLFPFAYMVVYLGWQQRKYSWRMLGKTIATFSFFSLPFFVWAFQKHFVRTDAADKSIYANWIALYKIACPQNFTFLENPPEVMMKNLEVFMRGTQAYWVLVALYLLNMVHNQKFRNDLKAQASFWTGVGLIGVSFVCSYVIPNRFILDLNLVRNSQYLLFILTGYTIILFFDLPREQWGRLSLGGFVFPLIRLGSYMTAYVGSFMLAALTLINLCKKEERGVRFIFFFVLVASGLIAAGWLMVQEFLTHKWSSSAHWGLVIMYGFLTATTVIVFSRREEKKRTALAHIMVSVILLVIFVNNVQYHIRRLKIEESGGGFWQMQRNWIDMQNYVRTHTPKGASLLAPNDMEMGGFRIFSERSVVCCYRDCGIIGFDYKAAVEWQRRLKDIDAFKVLVKEPITTAIANAIYKYKVNYIVFMRYLEPGSNALLEPVYHNDVFALYKVK